MSEANFNKKDFVDKFYSQGYVTVESVLDEDYIKRAKKELEAAIEKEVQYHKGKDYNFYGMVLVCSFYRGAFIELFDNKRVIEPFNAILGEGCIAYAYTSSSMPPQSGNETSQIHVDCPWFIPDFITRMGVTIPLDDFTGENGATWYLPFSHKQEDKPGEEEFFSNAKQLIVKAGSAWFFDTRLWHTGGINKTSKWRHALTINMSRPWMKQRVDIPRVMEGMDLSGVSEKALQKLGFYSQVPASYDEYWAPPEKRKFRQSNQ